MAIAKTSNSYLKIGEIARESGVGVEALRFYESRGLIEPAARSESGYRLYDAGVLDRLSFIKKRNRSALRSTKSPTSSPTQSMGVRPARTYADSPPKSWRLSKNASASCNATAGSCARRLTPGSARARRQAKCAD